MKLHSRILSAVALCIILVQVPAYIVYRLWITRGFSELETESAIRNMNQCRALIETDLNHLAVTAEDWASWDATWKFFQDRNETYLKENLGIDSFMSLKINLMHMFDREGRRVYSMFYTEEDKIRGRPSSLSAFSKETMPRNSPFWIRVKEQMVRGILSTEKGLLLVVSRPVLHSDDSGPVAGSLIMGKLIDRRYIESINDRIQLPFTLISMDEAGFTQKKLLPLSVGKDIHVSIRDDKSLFADLLLRDINEKPVKVIRAQIPRTVMEKGRATYSLFIIAAIVTGAVLLVLIHVFLYVTVVKRIKRLSAFVSNIDDPSAIVEPPEPKGTDELAALTTAFNKMMARLDRTGQKKQMESLLALSGGVAHDLNNILGPAFALPEVVIEELNELAQAKQLNIKGILEDLELISISNQRAALVVNDLSIMSSMGRIRKEPIVPRNIVKDVLRSAALSEAKASKPTVQIISELTAERRILGAEGPLSRLALNLVINAVDAVDKAGVITVTVKDMFLKKPPFPISDFQEGDFVVLEVADTGCGIDSRDLPHLFEPFFTRKLGFGRRGSGLGLAIVNGVTQDFGGRIHVESTLGKGTKFTVLFAALESYASDSTKPRLSSISPATIATAKILVVDDDEGQRKSAVRILEHEGYHVDTVDDGRAAVDRFASGETFSLVLLDMVMTDGFDGLDTFRAIVSFQPKVKVLVASGHAPSQRGAEIIALGAAWLPKLYTAKNLLGAIDSLLTEQPSSAA